MQMRIAKLAGMRGVLQADPRKVKTPEQFNAHLDSAIAAINTLRVEVAPAAPEPEPETPSPDEDKTEERTEPAKGRDRQRKGGRKRSEGES